MSHDTFDILLRADFADKNVAYIFLKKSQKEWQVIRSVDSPKKIVSTSILENIVFQDINHGL